MATATVESGMRTAAPPEAPCGALILDGRGVIVKCSDAATQMFGGKSCDLEGGLISSFVADLMSSDLSPSYNARHVAYLSRTGEWQRFQAVDVHGRRFPVDIAMSRMAAEDHRFLLLNLRMPGPEQSTESTAPPP